MEGFCVECYWFGFFLFFFWHSWPDQSGYLALLVRFSVKAKFTSRSVGTKKEEKTDKKDDVKKSEKDGKDEKEGKEKDEQKAGSSDRSRANKSGTCSCLSETFSRILFKKQTDTTKPTQNNNQNRRICTTNTSNCDKTSNLHPEKILLLVK